MLECSRLSILLAAKGATKYFSRGVQVKKLMTSRQYTVKKLNLISIGHEYN